MDVMHRILTPEEGFRQSTTVYLARAFGYACITAAGFLLILSPHLNGHTFVNLMAGFLAVGGSLSVLGSVLQHWPGEFIGLPLIVTALISLGLITWSQRSPAAIFISTANLALLVAFAILLLGRWRYMLSIYHIARAGATRSRRRGR